ncbi:uncharacterized protein TRAVEDRAFT_30055 [Trametes versicolor FP-101664 SS1]|uniref:uncharacterized protein n=1 Tax=Trametes versicolor (strain FP-101664) TaxID=717944 RepID=UPI0004622CFF|nr:uncharacterized protein TRAVEDRAFT_30055 [Trametes versicolor FP-101664 SS1]EIW56567.1 hypothetical protein TRAVEDRAFT_30055 [Trametes versicolor FP-101664 SS1]
MYAGAGKRSADMLMRLQNSMDTVLAKVDSLEERVKKLTNENNRLITTVAENRTLLKELRVTGDDTVERLDNHVERVENCLERIGDLEDRAIAEQVGRAAVAAAAAAPPSEIEVVAVASKRELQTRTFFACLRSVLQGMMGVRKKALLPKPMKRGFWSDEDPLSPTRLLRPRWEDGWPTNREGWVADVVQKVKRDGRRWSTSLSQEMLNILPDDVIEDGLETCFGNMAKRYKERRDQTKATREETLMYKRQRRRKVIKAGERSDVREHIPALVGPEWDWFFQWQYQSTDESDHSGPTSAIDPDTEQEGPALTDAAKAKAARVPARTRPWKQRAPAYRGATVTALYNQVDAVVYSERATDDAEAIQGNTHHVRIRGPPRPDDKSELPILRKNAQKKDGVKIELQKIPLAMVDPRWLSTETGRKFRHVQYIADWIAGETDVVVAEDEGVDDGGDEEDDVEE